VYAEPLCLSLEVVILSKGAVYLYLKPSACARQSARRKRLIGVITSATAKTGYTHFLQQTRQPCKFIGSTTLSTFSLPDERTNWAVRSTENIYP
jgi:hypothetical protein